MFQTLSGDEEVTVITFIIYYLVPDLYLIQDRKTSLSTLRVYNLNQRDIISVCDRTQNILVSLC